VIAIAASSPARAALPKYLIVFGRFILSSLNVSTSTHRYRSLPKLFDFELV